MKALSALCRAPAAVVKGWAEELLTEVSDVTVEKNATGLVLLPMQDSVAGGDFLLGEVLVAEAQVLLEGERGYAAVLGRDLEQALAVAVLDAASRLARFEGQVARWAAEQIEAQQREDETLLREVEATRVEMETF